MVRFAAMILVSSVRSGRDAGEFVEYRACISVLRLAPRLHVLVVPVFEPAVVVDDFDAVVGVGDGLPGRLRRGRQCQGAARKQSGHATTGFHGVLSK